MRRLHEAGVAIGMGAVIGGFGTLVGPYDQANNDRNYNEDVMACHDTLLPFPTKSDHLSPPCATFQFRYSGQQNPVFDSVTITVSDTAKHSISATTTYDVKSSGDFYREFYIPPEQEAEMEAARWHKVELAAGLAVFLTAMSIEAALYPSRKSWNQDLRKMYAQVEQEIGPQR